MGEDAQRAATSTGRREFFAIPSLAENGPDARIATSTTRGCSTPRCPAAPSWSRRRPEGEFVDRHLPAHRAPGPRRLRRGHRRRGADRVRDRGRQDRRVATRGRRPSGERRRARSPERLRSDSHVASRLAAARADPDRNAHARADQMAPRWFPREEFSCQGSSWSCCPLWWPACRLESPPAATTMTDSDERVAAERRRSI